jgi:cell wall-associated NlpC family hydrolase
VGYVVSSALGPVAPAATHWVSVPSTHVYPQANIKIQPAVAIPMLARVHVTHEEGDFAALHGGGYVYLKHLRRMGDWHKNFVSIAEQFLGTPYYWGGKTHAGLDCSGLVQISRQACGDKCSRDTDMQEDATAKTVTRNNALQRGDLVYWPGHVGIMQSATRIIHANGFHMQVTSELLSKVVARSGKPITSIKRHSIASK